MVKEYRPILKIPTTPKEMIYDSVSLGLVIGMVVVALWSFLNLPAEIPIHWNLKGEIDGFGSRNWIAFIPALSIVYLIVNNKLTKIPHKYNYLKTIIDDNAAEEYVKGRKLLRIVHMISQVVFAIIVCYTVKGAVSGYADLGGWFVPVVLITTLSPVIHTIYSSRE